MSNETTDQLHSQDARPCDNGIFINRDVSNHAVEPLDTAEQEKIQQFHASLPGYCPTELHTLSGLAKGLSLTQCLVKDESSRLGLPAFKILGASWGAYRTLCDHLKLSTDPSQTTIDVLRAAINHQRQNGNNFILCAATDGNHGRAVARMARLLLMTDAARDKVSREEVLGPDEIGAIIYVPKGMYESTRKLIRSEGARVVEIDGDYDATVRACWKSTQGYGSGTAIMIQDNAFEYHEDAELKMYRDVPTWIVKGYSTLLREVDEQSTTRPTHVITPIGVGSLGHAVVNWAKAKEPAVKVIAVEPDRARCLFASLKAGRSTAVVAEDTIMSGMCCGTVSPISYQALKDGVDVSISLSEMEAHQAVLQLREHGIEAGPCGAATLAALKKITHDTTVQEALDLNQDSVVLLLSTEGKREYPIPSN